ncbi:zinc finger MYM-type protein 1 [Trichonephila clavipes]|nr:zinc finger MYM-type protein 1 [Trichonephila clavipes]
MFDPSPFASPTPLAHTDTSRDVLPRGGTSQKYYSIAMDSEPDLSHNDQLAVVLRYCFRGKVYELIKISGFYLFNSLQEVLETNGLLLDNCRGQSFDNTAHTSGRYNGSSKRKK